jgi:hypothetical protein
MNLHNLQENFINYLYNPNKNDILSAISDNVIQSEKLLQIYRNNLFKNLQNSLKITFPLIYKYLGDAEFQKISYQYIIQNPSKSNNLDNYGERFCYDQNDFLKNLSKFEWLCHLSFLAADSKLITQEDLQKIDPEKLFNLKFTLNPAIFLLKSNYDFESQKKKQINYLIYRENNKVKTEKIIQNQFLFLTEIKNGLTLFEIYEKYEIDIGKLLAKYINYGILSFI